MMKNAAIDIQRLIRRARMELRGRYPYLDTEDLVPMPALQSPCCKTMLWLYDNNYRINYYCGRCGALYNEKLERQDSGKDLSALNKSLKSRAEKNKKQ